MARNELSVLRSSAGTGLFVLKDSAATLARGARDRPTEWFTDFDLWQKNEWLSAIRQAASDLHNDADASIAALASKPLELLTQADADGIDEAIVTLSRESRAIQARISDMKAFTDRKVKEALTLQANRNRGFLDELAQFIDTLKDTIDSDAEDGEDPDSEDDEDAVEVKTGRAAAMAAYLRCARAQARAHARKRSIKKTSRNGSIAEWLGDRGLPAKDLADVGTSLVLQSRARRLVNPATSFIHGMLAREGIGPIGLVASEVIEAARGVYNGWVVLAAQTPGSANGVA